MSSRRRSEARAEATSAAAHAIIGAEMAKHDGKTARLRKARLQKEAVGLLVNVPAKPRARILKASGKS